MLAGIAAGAVIDPELALWVPGAKTISIPEPKRLVYGEIFGIPAAVECPNAALAQIELYKVAWTARMNSGHFGALLPSEEGARYGVAVIRDGHLRLA